MEKMDFTEKAPDLATECVTLMAECGYSAEFTLDSLAILDRLISEHSAAGEAVPGGFFDPQALSNFPLERRIRVRLLYLGCFAGEILRREYGGVWHCEGDDPMQLSLRIKDISVNVIGKVVKRFRNGEEDSVATLPLLIAMVDETSGYEQENTNDGATQAPFEEGLAELLATGGKNAFLLIQRTNTDDSSATSVSLQEGNLIVETTQMSVSTLSNAVAYLGVFYNRGAEAALEEMTAPSGEKDYWTFYRINCKQDVSAAADIVRELVLLEFPDADLADFSTEVVANPDQKEEEPALEPPAIEELEVPQSEQPSDESGSDDSEHLPSSLTLESMSTLLSEACIACLEPQEILFKASETIDRAMKSRTETQAMKRLAKAEKLIVRAEEQALNARQRIKRGRVSGSSNEDRSTSEG
jgi:hypothetical protein